MQNLLHLLKKLNVPQVDPKVFILSIDIKADKSSINYQLQLELDTKQKD